MLSSHCYLRGLINPNDKDRDGISPITCASDQGHVNVVVSCYYLRGWFDKQLIVDIISPVENVYEATSSNPFSLTQLHSFCGWNPCFEEIMFRLLVCRGFRSYLDLVVPCSFLYFLTKDDEDSLKSIITSLYLRQSYFITKKGQYHQFLFNILLPIPIPIGPFLAEAYNQFYSICCNFFRTR